MEQELKLTPVEAAAIDRLANLRQSVIEAEDLHQCAVLHSRAAAKLITAEHWNAERLSLMKCAVATAAMMQQVEIVAAIAHAKEGGEE